MLVSPLTKEFEPISDELYDTLTNEYNADGYSSGAGFSQRDMQFGLDDNVNGEDVIKTVKDILNKYFKEGDYKVSIYDLDDNDEDFKPHCDHCCAKDCKERVEDFMIEEN
jgi:hypothetical protein